MRKISAPMILWRLMLAVSLVMTPLVPLAAQDHDAVTARPETATMPCHESPAAPPVDEAPCDDGCCPMPDCDPGACRLAGSLIAGSAPLLPSPLPAVPIARFASPRTPGAPFGEPLRPPIA